MRRPRFDSLGFALGTFIGVLLASAMAELGGVSYRSLAVRVALVTLPLATPIVAGYVPGLGPCLARSRLSVVFAAVPTAALLGFGVVANAGIVPSLDDAIPVMGALAVGGLALAFTTRTPFLFFPTFGAALDDLDDSEEIERVLRRKLG